LQGLPCRLFPILPRWGTRQFRMLSNCASIRILPFASSPGNSTSPSPLQTARPTPQAPCSVTDLTRDFIVYYMSGPWNRNEGHVPLSHAPIGSTCRVTSLLATGLSRRRLLDVGLVPGAGVRPVRRSPAGDPTAYHVKGTLIALRTREANQVIVEVFPPYEPAPVEKAAAFGTGTLAWLRRCPWFHARATRPAAPSPVSSAPTPNPDP